MFKPNYLENYKTIDEAISNMLGMIVDNPACAGRDGYCQVFCFGEWLRLKPKKKNAKTHQSI